MLTKEPCVYIMTNRKKGTLYIGVTSTLEQRVNKHKQKEVPGFTEKYNLTKLVYYEAFQFMDSAIEREKQLKNWKRSWKEKLIEQTNPLWKDLYFGI